MEEHLFGECKKLKELYLKYNILDNIWRIIYE